jgi:hypothetical protein
MGMAIHNDPSRDHLMLAQGRILEEFDDETVLSGTLRSLGRRFALAPDDLRACLRELVRAGWLVVQTQSFGRLTIRLEHRTPDGGAPDAPWEHRRSEGDAWTL